MHNRNIIDSTLSSLALEICFNIANSFARNDKIAEIDVAPHLVHVQNKPFAYFNDGNVQIQVCRLAVPFYNATKPSL